MNEQDLPETTEWDSPFRGLKKAETYALGGVVLHELFFNNITDQKLEVNGLEIEKFIVDNFGSMEE